MDINVVIQTMLTLFLILCTGYALNKFGVFDEYLNKKLSALIVNLTSPLLVIASVCSIENQDRSFVLKLIGIGIVMYIGFVLLGWLMSHLLPFPKKDRPVYELMCVFANNAFMGYPVVQNVLGTEAVFYTAMLHMAFSLFIYTYAVLRLNASEDGKTVIDLKKLLTPGFILCITAVVIYLFNIKLPSVIVSTVEMIGSVTSPLSMMMIGSSLAMYPLKESLGDWRSYLFAVVRLLLIPSITAGICWLFHVDSYFSSIAIITNGMPVATMVLMLATQYNASKEIVTRNIVVSTLLSVVTIPLIVALFIN